MIARWNAGIRQLIQSTGMVERSRRIASLAWLTRADHGLTLAGTASTSIGRAAISRGSVSGNDAEAFVRRLTAGRAPMIARPGRVPAAALRN